MEYVAACAFQLARRLAPRACVCLLFGTGIGPSFLACCALRVAEQLFEPGPPWIDDLLGTRALAEVAVATAPRAQT